MLCFDSRRQGEDHVLSAIARVVGRLQAQTGSRRPPGMAWIRVQTS